MLLGDDKELNIHQEFHLKQSHHEITFFAYDILKIDRITPYDLSEIFILECSDRDTTKGCKVRNQKELCCKCYVPHFQELLLDGWYVGNKDGFLDDNSYYAQLRIGIRVPVNKDVYEEWKKGWDEESYSGRRIIYELS